MVRATLCKNLLTKGGVTLSGFTLGNGSAGADGSLVFMPLRSYLTNFGAASLSLPITRSAVFGLPSAAASCSASLAALGLMEVPLKNS